LSPRTTDPESLALALSVERSRSGFSRHFPQGARRDRRWMETSLVAAIGCGGDCDVRRENWRRPPNKESRNGGAGSKIMTRAFKLIGRGEAVAQPARICFGVSALSISTGPGGIGKTAIALEVARASRRFSKETSIVVNSPHFPIPLSAVRRDAHFRHQVEWAR